MQINSHGNHNIYLLNDRIDKLINEHIAAAGGPAKFAKHPAQMLLLARCLLTTGNVLEAEAKRLLNDNKSNVRQIEEGR